MKHIGFVLSFTTLAALAGAQQGQVAGPVVGYVFDGSAQALRPVLGIPGASLLGTPLALGYDLTWAAVAPGGDSAVAMAADGSVHLLRLAGAQATEMTLNGASVAPSRAVFSPSGRSVALVASGKAQVFSGLPDAASLVATMDLGTGAARQVQAQGLQQAEARPAPMALTDDGAWLLVAANGSAQLVGAGGSHSIANAGRGSLVAFAPGSHDAALLDGRQSLTIIRSVDSGPAQQPLTPSSGVAGATGLEFSADGQSLYLAGPGTTVTLFDLAGGAQTPVVCGCSATGLTRMGNVYRLNELGAGPLWVLDPAPGHQRIVFVPAAAPE